MERIPAPEIPVMSPTTVRTTKQGLCWNPCEHSTKKENLAVYSARRYNLVTSGLSIGIMKGL